MKRIEKTWGHEEVLVNDQAANYCLKRLVLLPWKASSLHYHDIKHETFVVERGIVHVELGPAGAGGTVPMVLFPGDTMTLYPNTQHRFWASEPASFLEVSTFDREADSYRKEPPSDVGHKFASRWSDVSHVGKRVLVVGDVMLDIYYFLKVKGRSAEAPALDFMDDGGGSAQHMPGGAANVAALLADSGCHVTLVGSVGRDMDGGRLASLLKRERPFGSIDFRPVYCDGVTTAKTRFIADGQRVLRHDVDRDDLMDVTEAQAVIQAIDGAWSRDIDAIVICDHAKGVVSKGVYDAIEARTLGDVPVFVDPSRLSMATGECHAHGWRLVKPNSSEAGVDLSVDDVSEELARVADKMLLETKHDTIVITAREHGAVVASRDMERPRVIPAGGRSRAVDVTGAGDVFLTRLVIESLCGQDMATAVARAVTVSSEAVTTMRYDRVAD